MSGSGKYSVNTVSLFILSFLISFLVYLKTLCPTVYFGDSGEFITAAYCLGIPHNPGYPLYCLLGHLFIKVLPWGAIAFRVNLMSAFWAGLATALISLIIYKLTDSKGISFSFALVLAFSQLFWSQALIAEVYSLNAFNFCMLLFISIKWMDRRDFKYLYLFFFFLGVSLAGHLSILCFIPGFFLFIAITKSSSLFNVKRLPVFFLLCLFGLSLYAYLPIRSIANPPLDWGNPENLKNFLRHITGFEHRQRFIGQPDFFSILKRAGEILGVYKTQFSLIWLILGALGWVTLFKPKKALFFLAAFVFLGNYIYILFLNTAPLSTTAFGLPTYIVLSIGMAIAYFRITKNLSMLFKNICLFFPLILLLNNFHLCDMNNFYLARQYGMDILDNLPEGAVIFSEGDVHLFPMLYLKVVEGKRKDVEVIDRGGTLFRDVYNLEETPLSQRDKKKREVEKEIILRSGRPVYFTSKPDVADLPGRFIIPEGITYHVAKIKDGIKERKNSLTGLLTIREIWLERDFWARDVAADYLYFCGEQARFWRRGNVKDFYNMAGSLGHDSKFNHLRLARAYLDSGDIINAEIECINALSLDPHFVSANFILGEIYLNQGKFEQARIEFEKGIEKKPYQSGAHHNLGLALLKLGELDKAKREGEEAIKLDPGLWYPYVLMANIVEKEGDIEKAGDYRKKAGELNPNLNK